jgi:hypothetical protein
VIWPYIGEVFVSQREPGKIFGDVGLVCKRAVAAGEGPIGYKASYPYHLSGTPLVLSVSGNRNRSQNERTWKGRIDYDYEHDHDKDFLIIRRFRRFTQILMVMKKMRQK